MQNNKFFYTSCIKSLTELSPNAKIFILINKMDKVDQGKRETILLNRKQQFESKAGNLKLIVFQHQYGKIHYIKHGLIF